MKTAEEDWISTVNWHVKVMINNLTWNKNESNTKVTCLPFGKMAMWYDNAMIPYALGCLFNRKKILHCDVQ